MADYNFLLTSRLNQDQQLALQTLQEACQKRRLNLYFTGGSMRDLLTGQTVRLLNFSTEGDPLGLANVLEAAGGERLSGRAETATLALSLCGCRMRIQATRGGKEGKSGATIHEDLRRRGLTLNSMGLSLNAASQGLLLDPCNGAGDIEAGVIRMNDAYVFVEDPVTALRAVRLHTRLGFTLEERTAARMEAAREGEVMGAATAAARGQEWEAIAYEPDPAAVLTALEKERWLTGAFGASVKTSKMNLAGLGRLTAAVESWEQLGLTIDVGRVAMAMMMAGLSGPDQARLAQWLPSRHLAAGWKKLAGEAATFEKQLQGRANGGAWVAAAEEVVEKHSAEAVVYASVEPSDAKAAKKLREFQALALAQRQKLPFGVLRALAVAPRSLQAETILRPWYKRLLAGEALTEAELSEGIRAAVVRRAAAPPAAVAAREKPGKPGKKTAAMKSGRREGSRRPARGAKKPAAKAAAHRKK